jgi:hypothetical protein
MASGWSPVGTKGATSLKSIGRILKEETQYDTANL